MYELVQSESRLRALAAEIAAPQAVFFDTEFESTRQSTRLCLVQLRVGEQTYLLDTLRLGTIESLASSLGRPEQLWVLHGGQEDLPLLMSALGLSTPPRLVDTQVAWALLGPESNVSLAYLAYRVLGQKKLKAHQTDDWTLRPLPPSQLDYAADDVDSLVPLYQVLEQRLVALGRLTIAEHASRECLLPRPVRREPLQLSSFRHAWLLDATRQGVLVFLLDWYNRLSPQDRQQAPEPRVLQSIAARLPRDLRELGQIRGISPRFVKTQGEGLLVQIACVLEQGSSVELPVLEPAPYATFSRIQLDAWVTLLCSRVCARLGVAPELALPSRIRRNLADAIEANRDRRPEMLAPMVGPWRQELLGEALKGELERLWSLLPFGDQT